MIVVLGLSTVVAAQQSRSKGSAMNIVPTTASPELTQAISSATTALWAAVSLFFQASHNAKRRAAEYSAVYPDGTLHPGKPTEQQISAVAITGYKKLPLAGGAGWAGRGPRHIHCQYRDLWRRPP